MFAHAAVGSCGRVCVSRAGGWRAPALVPAAKYGGRDFPGEPYKLLKPIPVVVEWTGSGFLARFGDANMAMTGDTSTEALVNLAADVLVPADINTATNNVTFVDISSPHPDPLPEGEGTFRIRCRIYETEYLDTYEDYSAEADTLGPEPARQLAVLRQYIAKR